MSRLIRRTARSREKITGKEKKALRITGMENKREKASEGQRGKGPLSHFLTSKKGSCQMLTQGPLY